VNVKVFGDGFEARPAFSCPRQTRHAGERLSAGIFHEKDRSLAHLMARTM